MKKRSVIALVVAVALILTGGILVVLGLSFAADPARDSRLIQQEIAVPGSFDSIHIDTEDCDVTFAMFSGRDDCMVDLREYARVSHSVVVEDGTLKIKMIDERNWTDHIGVFHVLDQTETMAMTVYLPAAEYESLQLRTATGDIAVPDVFSFREMQLRSDTGEISCTGVGGDVMDCMTSTGDITVQRGTPNVIKLQSDTGDLKVSATAGDEIHLRTGTGDVDTENVTAQMVTCSTDTGEVELEQVQVADYLQVFTATGDVSIEDSDAARVNIETDTGDVSGHFLTPKWFSAHSDTGSVSVPNTPEGGECRIQSNTGSIRFE